ncbi:MAG: ATP:cob(I)alamin adenosyltransferase, partial [Duncaniella sp.]|nr:ATP:cob(I)alamin adenosyltransferase [Duncaniella sp.]
EYVDPLLLSYINRLSDYLFILARYFNHIAGIPEITWHK